MPGFTTAGALGPGGVDDVLRALGSAGATGVLELYSGDLVRRAALRRGDVFWISPGPGVRAHRLGEVLQATSRFPFDEPTVRRVAALSSAPVGAALIAQGLASSDDVDRALAEQLRRRAADLLAVTSGRWRFWSGPGAFARVPRLPTFWTVEGLLARARPARVRVSSPRSDRRRSTPPRPPRPPSPPEPWAVLGVGSSATRDEVRRALRRIARRHHPDRVDPRADEATRRHHRQVFADAARAAEQMLAISAG